MLIPAKTTPESKFGRSSMSLDVLMLTMSGVVRKRA